MSGTGDFTSRNITIIGHDTWYRESCCFVSLLCTDRAGEKGNCGQPRRESKNVKIPSDQPLSKMDPNFTNSHMVPVFHVSIYIDVNEVFSYVQFRPLFLNLNYGISTMILELELTFTHLFL